MNLATASRGGASNGQEWRRRRMLSRALRLAVFVGPIALSFAVAVALSNVLPRISGAPSAVLWMAVILGVSLATLVVFERLARRLLPLAALLDLCLVFPDRAPGRFAVARRSGRQSDLRESLRKALAAGDLHQARRMQTVMELVLALSVHDRGTRGHSERVRVFTDMLAEEMNVPDSGRGRLRWAAILHDIGKLEVPRSTLNKQGKPSEDEWAVLHRHPAEGAQLIASLMPWLGEWGSAVEQHHERFDGRGYPHGLRGDQISLAARIVSLADSFEVMTAPRSYKRPMSVVAAREELVRVAGTQLDPTAVRAFLNISVGRLWRAVGLGAWLAQFPLVARLTSTAARLGVPRMATAIAATVLALGGFAGAAGPGHVFASDSRPSPPVGSALANAPATSPAGGPSGGGAHAPVTVHPQTPAESAAPRRTVPSVPTTAAPAVPPAPAPPAGLPAAPLPAPAAPAAPAAPPAAPAAPAAPPARAAPVAPAPAAPAVPPASRNSAPRPRAASPPAPRNSAPRRAAPPASRNGALRPSARACTSHCVANNAPHCASFCQGNHNTGCRQWCYGDNDSSCVAHCYGRYDNHCRQDCDSDNRGGGDAQRAAPRRHHSAARPATHSSQPAARHHHANGHHDQRRTHGERER
ncbi:MAG: HD domain-containing protein [Candidatus Dormibacteraeota bacterium]|uniref:HD domain-containing protein n=1 Tax=Candidatus Amunia macphersoniae TaxID=3127014 RepID=A0A934KKC3_9BACT|nr:HD domain-containing protein [Candidatus Dormibacteraeota bacterium]